MAETIITWMGLPNGDAQREATRLAALFPKQSVLVPPAKIFNKSGFPVIIVGHDDDVLKLSLPEGQKLRDVTPWIVLAACSLVPSKFNGTLMEGNRMSPGQALADSLNCKVTAAKRFLTFDEVGKGLAFAASGLIDAVIPSNPSGDDLWQSFSKQTEMEKLSARLSLI